MGFGTTQRYWRGIVPRRIYCSFLFPNCGRFGTPVKGSDASLLTTYENALDAILEEANHYTTNALIEDVDLTQETAFFQRISYLTEELSMIDSVLSRQKTSGGKFLKNRFERGEIRFFTGQDRRTRAKLNNYHQRIMKLQKGAERIERKISTKLDLKQKHATNKGAHSTAILGAAVFGITVITVIFAPLSFIVALFALPIDKFDEGKYGKDGVYSHSYIGKWVVLATTEFVSIAITLLAMCAALRFADLRVWRKKGLREIIRHKADEISESRSTVVFC
ncbi:hypothetical protein RRF57_013093 [Xylaria bambusicola]|uniref:Ankyrin repeat protein n=1 Tax=Xylaria bambusicola TaxID=326684 RepID=A0AAN7V2G1_9PEZI